MKELFNKTHDFKLCYRFVLKTVLAALLIAFNALSNFAYANHLKVLATPTAKNDTLQIETSCLFNSTSFDIAVLLNDADADGDLNTNSVVLIDPANANNTGSSFTVAAVGSWSTDGTTVTFTPVTSFYGTASINYKVCDLTGGCSTATIFVRIGTANSRGCFPGSVWDIQASDTAKVITNSTGATNTLNLLGVSDYDSSDATTYATLAKNTANFIIADLGIIITDKDSFRIYFATSVQNSISTIKIEISTNNSLYTNLGTFSTSDKENEKDTAYLIPAATGVRYIRISYASGEMPRIDAIETEKWGCISSILSAQDDAYNIQEDIASKLTVLDNDFDPLNSSIELTIVTLPTRGNISVNPDNSISYLNTTDYPATGDGLDSFTYKICNAQQFCKTAVVRLKIMNDGCDPRKFRTYTTVSFTTTIQGTNSNMIDSYIKKDRQTENKGATNPLEIGKNATERRGFFRFNSLGIPSSAIITNAVFSIFRSGGDAVTLNFSAYRITKDWTETGVTWLKRDGTNSWLTAGAEFDPVPFSTISVTSIKEYKNFNVKSLVQNWVNSTYPNYGLLIKQNATTLVDKKHQFQSSESGTATQTPKLIINYDTLKANCENIPNLAPLANPDYGTIALDTIITISPLFNDAEPDGQTLSISSITRLNTSKGTFTQSGSTITYKPVFSAAALPRTDTLIYKISDGATPTPLYDSAYIFIKILFRADAGADTTICSSTNSIPLKGNLSGKATSCKWTSSGSGSFSQSTQLNTTYTLSAADKKLSSLTFYLNSNDPIGSCATATDKKVVYLSAAPVVTAGGPDTICQSAASSTISLSGVSLSGGATTGAWKIIAGSGGLSDTTQRSNPAVVTFTPTLNSSGTAILRLTTNATPYCSTISADRTIVVYAPTIPSNTPITACNSYSWNGNTYTTSGNYTFLTRNARGCDSSAILNLTINSNTALTGQPNTSSRQVCQNSSAPALTVTATGGNLAYQWYSNANSSTAGGTLITGATNPTYTPATTDSGTTYYYCIISGSCGSNVTSQASGSYRVTATGTWLGNNGNWNDAGNWCGGIPVATTNVIIPPGTPNDPAITNINGLCNNIRISGGATAQINSGSLNIKGSLFVNGILNAKKGTIELSGSAQQTIAGSNFLEKKIKNLIISNPAGVAIANTLNDTLKLTGILSFGNVNGAVLQTNNNLTLVSDSLGTASVGDLTNRGANSNNSIQGNVTVERYIKQARKWQFLSIPTNTTQSVKQAWMEGAGSMNSNPNPGYGTLITDNRSTWSTNGFDTLSPGGPSMKSFDPFIQSYVGITNTGNAINTNTGYMLFIRGDRTATPRNSISSPTILRTKGPLKQGTQSNIVIPADTFVAVGNPYACVIDMASIYKPGVQDLFYIWDPNLGGSYGVGGYQTFARFGNDYLMTPGWGSYGNPVLPYNQIQSGQGFFVKGQNTGGYVQFQENDKVPDSSKQVFRPGNNSYSWIRAGLFTGDGNQRKIGDGALVHFDPGHQNTPNYEDADKMMNSGINVAVRNGDKLLSVDRRKFTNSKDTIFLEISGLSQQTYTWDFQLSILPAQVKKIILVDQFSRSATNLNRDSSTIVQFRVNTDAGSSARNRFYIVFDQSGNPANLITDAAAPSLNAKTATVKIAPNPLKDHRVNMQFSAIQQGNYKLQLFNTTGQQIFSNNFSLSAGETIKSMILPSHIAKGNYSLSIRDDKQILFSGNVIVE